MADALDLDARLALLGEPGAPARRAEADRALADLPTQERAVELGLRERLGDDLPGWRALGDALAERACRATDGPHLRLPALELLARGWPGRPAALRREGRLATRPTPSWSEWEAARHQGPLLLAAQLDPDALLAVLQDRSVAPAAATLVGQGQPAFALEAAASASVHVARLEPARAAAFEAALRERALEVPLDGRPRCSSRALFEAHAALLEALGPVRGLPAALEAVEARLDQGAFDEHALHGPLRAAERLGGAARVVAASCLRRIADASRPAAARWAARQALQAARLAAEHPPSVDPWATAADELLARALELPGELRDLLRERLDEVLPPEVAQGLRRAGALPRAEVLPWGEVPGAATGNGNAIEAAGEALARRALPEELRALLERVADAPQADARELGRALTVLDVGPRLARRRAADGALLEPAVRRLLGDPRQPGPRSQPLGAEALRGWWRLLEALPAPGPAQRPAWQEPLREALERTLPVAPAATYYQELGPHAAVVVARMARRLLGPDAPRTLGPWLVARLGERARSPLERVNARRALDGLGDTASSSAGDEAALRLLADPTEDPALRRDLQPLVAERRPREVAALLDQGLLEATPPPPIGDLQVAVQGSYMVHEQAATEAAARAHPARLVAALPTLELDRLLGALLLLPRVAARAPEVAPAARAALLGLVADPRGLEVKKDGSRERFLVRGLAVAALRTVVERAPAPERRAALGEGLRASLRLEAVARALYGVHTDRWEASKAQAEAGLAAWRALVNALVEAGAAMAALEVAREVGAAGSPGERLAALDALCWLVARAAPADRPAAQAARDALLAALVAAGLVATAGLEGLFLPQDWGAERPQQPRFAWVA